MTIREAEVRSGMERAAIRFYEQEGLISPKRAENGYRDYSEEDLVTLDKVRLLRALGFTVAEIQALQRGETSLEAALPGRIRGLEEQKVRLDRASEICAAMHQDHVRYESLDARKYAVDEKPEPVPEDDYLPAEEVAEEKLHMPVRRFLARMLDWMAFQSVVYMLCWGVLRVNPMSVSVWVQVLEWYSGLILMWALEPLLLHRFGTTLGKAAMGLSVRSVMGGRLSREEARRRMNQLMWSGMGLGVPLVREFLWAMHYSDEMANRTNAWDYDTEFVVNERRKVPVVYAVCCAVCLMLTLLAACISSMPGHLGRLTVQEFSQNYNSIASYEEQRLTAKQLERVRTPRMDENGKLKMLLGGEEMPMLMNSMMSVMQAEYVTDGEGQLEQVIWRFQTENNTARQVHIPKQPAYCAAQAFLGAEAGPFGRMKIYAAMDRITGYEGAVEVCGGRIEWHMELTGYEQKGLYTFQPIMECEDRQLTITLTLSRT